MKLIFSDLLRIVSLSEAQHKCRFIDTVSRMFDAKDLKAVGIKYAYGRSRYNKKEQALLIWLHFKETVHINVPVPVPIINNNIVVPVSNININNNVIQTSDSAQDFIEWSIDRTPTYNFYTIYTNNMPIINNILQNNISSDNNDFIAFDIEPHNLNDDFYSDSATLITYT